MKIASISAKLDSSAIGCNFDAVKIVLMAKTNNYLYLYYPRYTWIYQGV
jgi:hypothetical protein